MENELNAVLIDAFDAEPAAMRASLPHGMYKHQPDAVPSRSVQDPATTSAPIVALRHYPTLDALGSPGPSQTTPPSHPMTMHGDAAPVYRATVSLASTVRYPRWPTTSTDTVQATPSRTATRVNQQDKCNTKELGLSPPRHQEYHHHSFTTEEDHTVQGVYATDAPLKGDLGEATTPLSPPRRGAPPTDEEIAQQQRLLQAEIKRFQAQADYIALALAGETPHQLEARRQREQERKEREERRLAAMETRVLNVIERQQQRETRQLERRLRHAERTHRASVSPSPEREDTDDDDDSQQPQASPPNADVP